MTFDEKWLAPGRVLGVDGPMTDLTLKVITESGVPVKFLRARCGVRYWEDAEVNGKADEDGSLIPCRNGEEWCPLIDLAEGRIVDWPPGTTASIHYKVCDEGVYELLDKNCKVVIRCDGYVIG